MAFNKLGIKKDLSFVFSSNLISSIFYFLITITATRYLPMKDFGVFAIYAAIGGLLPFFMDLGLNITNLKFLSENDGKEEKIIGTMLWLRIGSGLLIFVFSLIFGKFLIDSFFKINSSYLNIQIMVFSTILLSVVSLLQTVLQSSYKFLQYSIVTVLLNFARFFLIFTACFFGYKSLDLMIFLYFSAILAPFAAVVIFTKKQINFSFDNEKLKCMINFSKWVALSTIITAVIMRVDTIMLGIISSKEEVAKYALAFQIAFIIPLFTNAVFTVLFPRVVSIENITEFKKLAKWLLKTAPIQAAVCIVLLFISKYFILFVFGESYADASSVLNILIISFVVGFFAAALNPLFYALNIPQSLFYIYFCQLIANILLNLVLIPPLGAEGSAISSLVIRIFGVIATWYIIIWYFKHRDKLKISSSGSLDACNEKE